VLETIYAQIANVIKHVVTCGPTPSITIICQYITIYASKQISTIVFGKVTKYLY